MRRKGLLILILALAFAGGGGGGGGGLFAQDFESMPKNTITVDFGPTIIGAAIGSMGSMMGGSEEAGVSTSGFGIGAQYERQLSDQLSVAGRFAYLSGGIGIDMGGGSSAGFDISSFSIEGHARFYPLGTVFFLDGMLGYANLTAVISGKVQAEYSSGRKEVIEVEIKAPRDYFKLGAKLGWRIDFGNAGGFVFEPSLGYYAGIGLNDKIGDSLANEAKSKYGIEMSDLSNLNEVFDILEPIIFIGGPRFTLSFGWRF